MGLVTSVPKLLQKIEKEVAKTILRRVWNEHAEKLFDRSLGNTTALSRDDFQVFVAEILIAHAFESAEKSSAGRIGAGKIREYLVCLQAQNTQI